MYAALQMYMQVSMFACLFLFVVFPPIENLNFTHMDITCAS